MTDISTYDEAVSEAHRPGHEPTWEINNGHITCSLCGWTYNLNPT